jgi:hypothetical protein
VTKPWLALPTDPPFVLAKDRPILEGFNRTATSKMRVETKMLPEPYVGRLDAPIILLLLNPGVPSDPRVAQEDLRLHRQPAFRERVRRCHRPKGAPYPNYFVDPAAKGPGARWNLRILAPLLKEFGAEAVANGVTSMEYFPYHSEKFAHRRLRVPSQGFTFEQLRAAIRREAVIFVTRGKSVWEEAVPELRGYARAFLTRSVQNVVISPRNCPEGYEAAQVALRKIAGP